MSKIDKIIQILDSGCDDILGLSESGRMYKYRPELAGGSLRYNACWELEIESPVVDNSAELAERLNAEWEFNKAKNKAVDDMNRHGNGIQQKGLQK